MFLAKQPELVACLSDVTLHVNMTPVTVEDRLLIKTSKTEKKAGLLKNMIVEFPAG